MQLLKKKKNSRIRSKAGGIAHQNSHSRLNSSQNSHNQRVRIIIMQKKKEITASFHIKILTIIKQQQQSVVFWRSSWAGNVS